MGEPRTVHAIRTQAELRAIIGEPTPTKPSSSPERSVSRNELLSLGELLCPISLPDLDVEAHERERAGRYARRDGFS